MLPKLHLVGSLYNIIYNDTLSHYVSVRRNGTVPACTARGRCTSSTSLPFKTPEPNIRDRTEGEQIDHSVAGTITLQPLYESILGP